LEDRLTRLARWEQLLRRAAAKAGTGARAESGPADGSIAAARADSAEEQVIGAVREVVGRHPGVRVTVTVEEAATRSTVRVGWRDGVVAVESRTESGPVLGTGFPAALPARITLDPAPIPVRTPGPAQEATATRLAKLLRMDPSLLDGET
jgi:hypothetical protein